MTRYQQFEVTLEPGDLVLCYTDSLIESLDAAGELLGLDGLMRIVRSLDVSDPSKLIPALLAAVRAEHAANLEDDDVTALLFRPTGTGGLGPPGRRRSRQFAWPIGFSRHWFGTEASRRRFQNSPSPISVASGSHR